MKAASFLSPPAAHLKAVAGAKSDSAQLCKEAEESANQITAQLKEKSSAKLSESVDTVKKIILKLTETIYENIRHSLPETVN